MFPRILIVLTSFLALQAQEAAPQAPAACLHKAVAVSVLGPESGQALPGLTRENFRARAGGRELRVSSATLDSDSKRFLVMLDASGSMLGDPQKWETARKLASLQIESSQAPNSVAVIVFAKKVDQKVGFQGGREAALAAVASLPDNVKKYPKGSRATALLDALKEGLDLFGPPQFGDTVVLITDGGDNASQANQKKLRQTVIERGVRIFVLLFPDNLPRSISTETSGYRIGLDADGAMIVDRTTHYGTTTIHTSAEWDQASEWAKHSGGQVLLVDARQVQTNPSQALTDVTSRLAQVKDHVYRLELDFPESVPKPKGWELKVVAPKGTKVKDSQLLFPRKIAACPIE